MPIFDREGDITGLAGFAQDITERMQAEEELKESEEKYRTLYETMAEGVIYQDKSGEVITMNPSAERILGYRLDQIQNPEVIDANLKAIREDGSGYPAEEHPTMISLKTGKPVYNEIMGVYNPHEQGYRWILINAVPQFKPGEDEPYQSFVTFSDITERRRSEERISNLNRTLRCIRDVNQIITREKDRDRLIKDVCDTLVESRNFNFAWIALLDSSRKLVDFAASGSSRDYSSVHEMLRQGKYPRCVQKALSKESIVITRNQQSECADCPLNPGNAEAVISHSRPNHVIGAHIQRVIDLF